MSLNKHATPGLRVLTIGPRCVARAALPAKRLTCKTCDGKVCVGRCRFEKV